MNFIIFVVFVVGLFFLFSRNNIFPQSLVNVEDEDNCYIPEGGAPVGNFDNQGVSRLTIRNSLDERILFTYRSQCFFLGRSTGTYIGNYQILLADRDYNLGNLGCTITDLFFEFDPKIDEGGYISKRMVFRVDNDPREFKITKRIRAQHFTAYFTSLELAASRRICVGRRINLSQFPEGGTIDIYRIENDEPV